MKWLFWCAACLVIYTYVGYAAWLWLRARLHPWPVLRAKQEPDISIVMVVRNEERWLEGKLRNLMALDYPPERCQIVVVSDGSTDKTESILREFSNDPRISVVFNQLSQGKACGLNDAMAIARGEVIVFTDARQKIEPAAIRLLMENFADPDVGCASGELMLGDPESGETKRGMGLYWRIEKEIRELEAASGSVIGATGALYAVKHELVSDFPKGTILDDVYLPMQVVKKGKRAVFEPRARAWDVSDLGAEQEFNRKVRTLSGNYQLMQALPWLLSRENPVCFRFVSHKLLRLAVPFALAAAFIASIFLSGVVYRVALVLQLLFYGLSLLALLRLNWGPLARMADASLTFVVLNTAAAVAFANFITGRKPAWGG
ncbi:MAG TPA: glycosyltransferase family 2 protein [Candidatus Sulfotelmatobacter sp.]|jgi:cellulose synthase/poly-beta-1,6-N-acetylglucosamine synthase-like glycosyltransferase|nr:glycosyltransferase family 2 protein [Candidatus Sulfotelmatobacter sp.]